jgi:uncharacterized protein (TIGR03435 family)
VSWLEMHHFDVIAKEQPDSTPEARKPMLQSLLADRCQSQAPQRHQAATLPTYALIAGKKPLVKPADGTEDTGCKIDTGSIAPAGGTITLNMSTSAGA